MFPRRSGSFLLLFLLLILLAPAAPQPPWTNAFWFWKGSAVSARLPPVDVLYVQVEENQRNLPNRLPAARTYWLVYRTNREGLPSPDSLRALTNSFTALAATAQKRGMNIAGIQLDIDSPTAALPEYAKYLHLLRQRLPAGTKISITALLDWFRSGTSVGTVIGEVDEFIPQFYDLEPTSRTRPLSIAAPIDAKRWGPVFNQYNRPFRIGISTFGRARQIPALGMKGQSIELVNFNPRELGGNPAFRVAITKTDAQELTVTYTATKEQRRHPFWFDAGTRIEFTMATPESIRAAIQAARQMGGNCLGTAFFRWPSFNEGLSARPEEILREVGISIPPRNTADLLLTEDGGCAAVTCTELYLDPATPLSAKPQRYEIESSEPLDYFLPAEHSPVKLLSPTHLAVTLPPYSGRASVALGRAVVSRKSAKESLKFAMKEVLQ